MPHLKTGKCPGFLQEFGYKPFFVSLYSNRQLLLLRNYLTYNPGGLLTLDSTGNVIGSLPKCYGEKKAFYYALVINLPGATESPVVPILEYITNDHTAKNNSHILHFFFRKYDNGPDELNFIMLNSHILVNNYFLIKVRGTIWKGPDGIWNPKNWNWQLKNINVSHLSGTGDWKDQSLSSWLLDVPSKTNKNISCVSHLQVCSFKILKYFLKIK